MPHVTAIKVKSIFITHIVGTCQSRLTVVLLTQLASLKIEKVLGRASRIEDVDKNSSAGGRVGLSHDVLNVFFDGLFSDQEGISDFFVGPPLCQMFNN